MDAPSNINTTVLTSRSVRITWSPSSSLSNVTGYLISYTTTVSYTSGGSVIVNGINTTTSDLTNLEEYTLYTITIQAISGGRMSGNSNETSVTTYSDSK